MISLPTSLDALASAQSVYDVREGEPSRKYQKTEAVATLSSCPPVEEKDQSFLGYDVTVLMRLIEKLLNGEEENDYLLFKNYPEVFGIFSLKHFWDVKESAQAYMAAFRWDQEKQERGLQRLEGLYHLYLINSSLGMCLQEMVDEMKETRERLELLQDNLKKAIKFQKELDLASTMDFDSIELRHRISRINKILLFFVKVDAVRALFEPLEYEHLTDLLKNDSKNGSPFRRFIQCFRKKSDLFPSVQTTMKALYTKRTQYEKNLREISDSIPLQKKPIYDLLMNQFSIILWESIGALLLQLIEKARRDFSKTPSLTSKELNHFLSLNKNKNNNYLIINNLCDEYLLVDIGDLILMAFSQVETEKVMELESNLCRVQDKHLRLEESMRFDEIRKVTAQNFLQRSQLEICKKFFEGIESFTSLEKIRAQVLEKESPFPPL